MSGVHPSNVRRAQLRYHAARYRKRLLLSFAFVGAISAVLFFILPSSSPIWQTSALLTIVSNVCFGASMVALNAYLPSLARNSEEVTKAAAALADAPRPTGLSEETDDSEDAGLLASGTPSALVDAKAEYSKALTTATSRISSRGIAAGYLAGILLLVVALVPVTRTKGSTLSLRLAIGMSGVWWGVFSLPAAIWLPSGSARAEEPEKRTVWRQILFSWKRLGEMLRWKEIKRLRNTFKYLAAWFLLSDGPPFRRILRIFAYTFYPRLHHHHLDSSSLLENSLVHASFFAHPHRNNSANLWYHWFARLAVSPTPFGFRKPQDGRDPRCPHFTGTSVWVLGLPTGFPTHRVWGAEPPQRDVWPSSLLWYVTTRVSDVTLRPLTTTVLGFVYGAFQAYARAFYAELIPRGEEAKWYALFSITDKVRGFCCSPR